MRRQFDLDGEVLELGDEAVVGLLEIGPVNHTFGNFIIIVLI